MFDQPAPKPNKLVVLLKVLVMIGIVAGCGWVLKSRMQSKEPDPAKRAAQEEAEARKKKDQLLANLAASTMTVNADELEGKAVALEAAAASLRGNDQLFCRGAANILRNLIPVTKAYRAAFEQGSIEDVMDVSSVESRGDIKLRLEHLVHLQRVLKRQEAQFEMLAENLREEFRELGAPPATGEDLVKVAMTSFGPATKKRLAKWQTQRAACVHSLDAIRHLDDTWGQWKVDGEEIVFEEARHTAKYNRLVDLVEDQLKQHAAQDGEQNVPGRK